jgi:hypothetical protein
VPSPEGGEEYQNYRKLHAILLTPLEERGEQTSAQVVPERGDTVRIKASIEEALYYVNTSPVPGLLSSIVRNTLKGTVSRDFCFWFFS